MNNEPSTGSTSNCAAVAMRLLSRREHSSFELTVKLRKRGFESSAIEQALALCRRLNALDDRRYAEAAVHHLQVRGYGPAYIRRYLECKRVENRIIDQCLNHHLYPESALREACRKLLYRKTGGAALDPAVKPRLFRFLIRRGFSPDTIFEVFEEAVVED